MLLTLICVLAAPLAPSVVTGPTPSLAGPLAGLRLGMTKAEALRLHPDLLRIAPEVTHQQPGDIEIRFRDVVRPPKGPQDQVLCDVHLFFRHGGNADRVATEAWGKPVVRQHAGKAVHFWFDPSTHVRAMVLVEDRDFENIIFLSPYATLEEILATSGLPFAFERVPVIGKTRAELRAAFGDLFWERDDPSTARIDVPAAAYATYRSGVDLAFDHGKVTSYELIISAYADSYSDEEFLRPLAQKFGPATTQTEEGKPKTTWTFAREPRVRVERLRDRLLIKVSGI